MFGFSGPNPADASLKVGPEAAHADRNARSRDIMSVRARQVISYLPKLMESVVAGLAGASTNDDGGGCREPGGNPRKCHSTVAAPAVEMARQSMAEARRRSTS